jgi:hypothetical protein
MENNPDEKQPELKPANVVDEALKQPKPDKKAKPARIKIQDAAGFLPVSDLRNAFENMVRNTELLKDRSLKPIPENNGFSGYANPVTDQLWLGFALGCRYQERYQKSLNKSGIRP